MALQGYTLLAGVYSTENLVLPLPQTECKENVLCVAQLDQPLLNQGPPGLLSLGWVMTTHRLQPEGLDGTRSGFSRH